MGGAGAEDVELGAAASAESGFGQAQAFRGLLDSFALCVQQFEGLLVIVERLADFEFDTAPGVGIIEFRLAEFGAGLFHFAARGEAVEDVPAGARAGIPAVDGIVNLVGECGVADTIAGKGRDFREVAGAGDGDILPAQGGLFLGDLEFGAVGDGGGQGRRQLPLPVVAGEFAGKAEVGVASRPVTAVGEEATELNLVDAERVAGADEGRFGVGHFHFSAQDVELRDRADIEAVLHVGQLLFEQFEGFFADGDELGVEEDFVKCAPHLKDDIGHSGVVIQHGNLIGQFCSAQGGADSAAGVECLGQFHIGAPRPALVVEGRGAAREGLNSPLINLAVLAGGGEVGDGLGAGFHDDAVGAPQFLLGFENGDVLFEREFEALCESEREGGIRGDEGAGFSTGNRTGEDEDRQND